MKKVYIAHPLRGNVEHNMQLANNICKELAANSDIVPFSPLHAFDFLNPEECDIYQVMQYCFALLESCDEIWVHGNWQFSEGCKAEIDFAKCRGIPIRIQAKGRAGWLDIPNPKRKRMQIAE